MPITDGEAERILRQVQEGIERPKPSITFEIGEQVRVSDGPFASFNGLVEESRRGEGAAQGCGVDLRSIDAGRPGIRSGREGLTGTPAGRETAGRGVAPTRGRLAMAAPRIPGVGHSASAPI
jgi:hypothetical protein